MNDILKDIDFLKENQKTIQKLADKGCKICRDIISYYTMYSKCSDGVSQMFLQSSINDYKTKYKLHVETKSKFEIIITSPEMRTQFEELAQVWKSKYLDTVIREENSK